MYGKARRGDDTGRQVVYSVGVTVYRRRERPALTRRK